MSGRYRPAENFLLTKHVVAAGSFAKDPGSTPGASTIFYAVVLILLDYTGHLMPSVSDFRQLIDQDLSTAAELNTNKWQPSIGSTLMGPSQVPNTKRSTGLEIRPVSTENGEIVFV